MRITTEEVKQDSVQQELQERKQPQKSEPIKNQQTKSNLQKINNLFYFVGIIQDIKHLSEYVDVLNVITLDKEFLPPVLCQVNKDFKPEIGKQFASIGKIVFIKDKFYIQLGEVFY